MLLRGEGGAGGGEGVDKGDGGTLFCCIPSDILAKVIAEYLMFCDWSRLEVALCINRELKGLYLEALKSEIIQVNIWGQ